MCQLAENHILVIKKLLRKTKDRLFEFTVVSRGKYLISSTPVISLGLQSKISIQTHEVGNYSNRVLRIIRDTLFMDQN